MGPSQCSPDSCEPFSGTIFAEQGKGEGNSQQPIRRWRFAFARGTSGGSGRCIEEHYALILNSWYTYLSASSPHIIIDLIIFKRQSLTSWSMCPQPVADCGASGWRSELGIMARPGWVAAATPGRAVYFWSVGWCVRLRERKEGSVCVCLGPTACDSATMTYASMGYGSMDRDKRKYGR